MDDFQFFTLYDLLTEIEGRGNSLYFQGSCAQVTPSTPIRYERLKCKSDNFKKPILICVYEKRSQDQTKQNQSYYGFPFFTLFTVLISITPMDFILSKETLLLKIFYNKIHSHSMLKVTLPIETSLIFNGFKGFVF